MLISTHFPCADARGFLPGGGLRLPVPRWSDPDPERDFVRHFGPIRVRVSGGATLFPGEDRVCRADGALRFPAWPRAEEGESTLRCVFRGLFADGDALAKFDIGVAGAARARDGSVPAEARPRSAVAELRRVLDLPVVVPLGASKPGPAKPAPLGQSGGALSRAYLRASTILKPAGETQDWWVRGGSPVLTLQYNARDRVTLPPDATHVAPDPAHGGIALSHFWLPYAGTHRRVWLLGYEEVHDYALARQLRVDLVRLHCERECLRIVLRHVATGKLAPTPRSPESDALQRYLTDTFTRVTRLTTERRDALSVGAAAIVSASDGAGAVEIAALRSELDEQLRKIDVRPNLRRRAEAWPEDLRLGNAEIVELLVDTFDRAELERLCTRITDLLREAGIDDPVSLDIVGGDGLHERADNLVRHLDRRGHLALLRQAVRA